MGRGRPLTDAELAQVRALFDDEYPDAADSKVATLLLGAGRMLLATLDAKQPDVRAPKFIAAVDAVFAAPGEFGPAKGYYGPDTGHFIDMLAAELEAGDAPDTAATIPAGSEAPLAPEAKA